jgi:carbon-monoxide dehydrogenase large subunit
MATNDTPTGNAGRFGSGRAVQRIEDAALLRGEGRFTDDFRPAGTAVLRFVRSNHARGRIVSVDAEAARQMPGVLAVYTGADLATAGLKPLPPAGGFPRADGKPMDPPPRHVLAVDVVNFVGEPVAAVVAETAAAAQDASDAVLVEIDELPAVVAPLDAVAPGAPELWPGAPGNVVGELRHGRREATDAAFAQAAHRVSLDVVNQRLAPAPIEPRSVVAWMEAGRLQLRISNQMPTAVRAGLAACLGTQPEDIRVTVADVGGGFGMKTGPYAEDVVVGHAARALGRPVKWIADRLEEFLSAFHGRDLTTRAEMALDANGRVLAMRLRSYANVGAYPTGAGCFIGLALGPWVTTGIYDIQTIDFHLSAVLTNTAPIGPYRGAGRPEAVYLCERLMDAAARKLGIPGPELRRRNMIRPDQFPYKNAMGQTYDCGQFERILDRGLALAEWDGFDARRAASQARGKLRGRGIATFLEWTGGPQLDETVKVRVAADGFIEMTSATMAMGQGIQTSYAQLAVDVFGVPIDKIRIVQGDTDLANGFGSAASRSLFTGGGAVQVASQNTVEHAKHLAGDALEVPAADLEFREGRFAVAGTDVGIGLFELAAKQPGRAIRVEGTAKAQAASWPNACHVAEVEIDPETGHVDVVAYSSVNDIGRVISPTIVHGQVEGGAVQGIGQALCEAVAYDPQSGQLLTASFMDYAMPRADGAAFFRTEFDESVPCLTNRLGAKGVGELGTIGATPAVVNAVVDALDHAGLGARAETVQMPLTSAAVWRALQGELPAPMAWPA